MIWGFMAYGDGLEFMVWAFMGQDLELWFMGGLWRKRLWDSTDADHLTPLKKLSTNCFRAGF